VELLSAALTIVAVVAVLVWYVSASSSTPLAVGV
jgi:hypothetical protein